ncbi:MAG: LptF/LptG family permease [Pseudobdellovibrionaceae bacterium]
MALENLARQGQIPATLGMWTPNILFIGFAFYRLKLIW